MTSYSSIKELDDLGERFHRWKQNNPNRHVPKKFWDETIQILDKYSIDAVACAIGYPPAYVLHKQQKKQAVAITETEFVEIHSNHTISDLNPIRVNIQNHQGINVELSFQGNLEQIFPLISTLFKEGNPCSK
jgi:hypothetical protein